MTGFGTAAADTAWGRINVELRSLNHRFTEVLVRLPRDLAPLEDRVRALVQRGIQRGRVEVTVSRENQGGRSRAVRADLALAREYQAATRQLKRALRLRGSVTLQHVLAFPEVVRLEETREDAETLWADLEKVVGAALDGLLRMRTEEGGRLAADTRERLDRVEALQGQVLERSQQVVGEYTVRLRQRLAELLGEVPLDEARLAAELALFAERSDITEELTRLGSHLSQFRETMTGEGAVGRKLEFLLQEMGRETNTIGAKANDLEISRAVIAIKSELESLREQVQNVE
jgi:uncharacterized protein (TIGR00255 family)